MKSHLFTLGALALALLGPVAPAASAQDGDPRAGTAAMEELLVPVTPRTVALGQTLTGGLANLAGVEAVYSNPGALATNQGTNAMFSRMEYVADIGINTIGIAQSFGVNNIALTLTAWDYGDIPRTTVDDPEINPSNTWTGSSLAFGLSYARQFTDNIAAGVTLKGLGQKLDEATANGVAFDAGMTYTVGESGLRFGVSLRNFGTSMSFSGTGLDVNLPVSGPNGTGQVGTEIQTLDAELPSVLNFGASYTRQFEGSLSATGLLNVRSRSYDLDEFAAGLEVGYDELFYVRGGVNVTSQMDLDHWDVWTVGAGLYVPVGSTSLRVDYGFRPSVYFSGSHLFSVGINI